MNFIHAYSNENDFFRKCKNLNIKRMPAVMQASFFLEKYAVYHNNKNDRCLC